MNKLSLMTSVMIWLAEDKDVGASATTMAYCACGINKSMPSHPHDPADFRRCMKLLEKIPEIRKHFPAIRELSPKWRVIIDNWQSIEELLIAEIGDLNNPRNLMANRTYKRMQNILERVKDVA